MSKKKYYTKEEARDQFMKGLKELARYWANETRTPDPLRKIEGALFSLLVMLDGGGDFPSCDIVLRPHPENTEYKNGMVINDDCELHGVYGFGYRN